MDFDSFEKAQESDLSIACDPDLLGILFYNLIENAIKYSPENSKVLITGINDPETITVIVSDEGSGIDEQQISKVFDRFYRSNSGLNKETGSGLGLAICQVVSDSLGASLWASNNPLSGTSFYFKIKK